MRRKANGKQKEWEERYNARRNNGLIKTKYLTFSIEADSLRAAKPRLERIETDVLNNFKRLGVSAEPLDGKARLAQLHAIFHMDEQVPFRFEWEWLAPSGLSTKDFIAPSSFAFRTGKQFQMGKKHGAVSFVQILAPELNDRMLADFLDMESSLIVSLHIQSVDQVKAIKTVKRKITDLDRSKIEEQKKAVRAGYTVAGKIHQEIRESEDDNVGVESAHKSEEVVETGARLVREGYRSHKLKPYRKAAQAERKLEKANVNALYHKALRENPQLASNPFSRWQQKRAIKKQYAAAKHASQTAGTATGAAQKVGRAAQTVKDKVKQTGAYVMRHKKGAGIVLVLFFMVCLLMNTISSCSMMAQSIGSGVTGSTFPSRDEDMLGAEAAYAAKEAELQSYLDNYESTHDYDEYHFDLDEIGHDPYVLISILTAYHEGEWTLSEVQGTLDMLFERQYILTEEVVVETRYRTETRTGTREVTDPETGETTTEEYDYEVEVPYDYYICYVTLENFDLSHLPVYIMDEDKVSMYCISVEPDAYSFSHWHMGTNLNRKYFEQ